jgi:hypothetical protein
LRDLANAFIITKLFILSIKCNTSTSCRNGQRYRYIYLHVFVFQNKVFIN